MELLDLKDIFCELDKEDYCIIRYRGVDLYNVGDDIDIFCIDPNSIINIISNYLIANKNEDDEIIIENVGEYNHYQLDYRVSSKLYFRFDIYGEMPKYKKVKLKESFFSHVIDNAVYDQKLKHSCDVDDLILRYVEFVEYYYIRPDKLKHLEFVRQTISGNYDLQKKFWDYLYYYTEFPNNTEDLIKKKEKFYVRWRKKIVRRIKKYSGKIKRMLLFNEVL